MQKVLELKSVHKIWKEPDLISCVHGLIDRIVSLGKNVFMIAYILNIKIE